MGLNPLKGLRAVWKRLDTIESAMPDTTMNADGTMKIVSYDLEAAVAQSEFSAQTRRADDSLGAAIMVRTDGTGEAIIALDAKGAGGAGGTAITLNDTNIVLTGLPAAAPPVAGALWVDVGGVLKVSAGA